MATATEPRRATRRTFQTKMLIDGKWRDSRQRQDVRDGQPGDRGGHRRGRRGGRRRHRPRRQGRPQGVRLRPLAQDRRPRPRPAALQARRPDRAEHRRAGRARDPRQRQADLREPQRRPPARDRLPPLLRRLGRQDPRPDHPGPGQLLLLHPARAGRRRRADHPLELPDADGRLEVGPRARRRLHGRPEARRADPAVAPPAWASWPSRPGSPPGVINIVPGFGETAGDALVKHKGVDKIAFTGSTERRPDHHAERRRHAQAGHAGTRRQEPEHRLRRRRPRRRRRRARCSASTSTRASAAARGAACSCRRTAYDEMVEKLAREGRARASSATRSTRRPSRGRRSTRPSSTRSSATSRAASSRGPGASPGGERHGDKGFFIKPTIFADVKDDMTIAREEIFGPVMQVLRFKDVEEVVDAGQHDRLRPGRGRLDPRHRQGPRDRRPRPRGHGLDQLLRRLRRRRPVRRVQAQRHRPRAGREGARQLHRAQDRHRLARLKRSVAGPTASR